MEMLGWPSAAALGIPTDLSAEAVDVVTAAPQPAGAMTTSTTGSRLPLATTIRLTPQQIALVRESFAKVVPIREQAAGLFYDRLFAIDPSTRPLFRGDMKSQGAKLMAAIGAVVKSLDRIETMLDDLRALARSHNRYGVREEHYASVGAALLWTLEQGVGLDFTPDVREAWATAYGLLSSAIIAASSEPLRGAV